MIPIDVIILFGVSVAVLFLGIVTFFIVLSYHKALVEQARLKKQYYYYSDF